MKRFTCSLDVSTGWVLAVLMLIALVGCGKAENKVIQRAEDYQPTAQERANAEREAAEREAEER